MIFSSLAMAAPSAEAISGLIINNESINGSGLNFGNNETIGTNNIEWIGDDIENGLVGNEIQTFMAN